MTGEKQGFKKTEVGLIPEDWEVKQLGDIAEIVSGGTPSTKVDEYWDGTIMWCTPTDITSNKSKYLCSTKRTITEKGLANSSATLLPKGTLLFCSRATIGEVKIAQKPISTNQGFKSLISFQGIDNEFLYYLVSTSKQKFLERSFGSTFLEISKKNISEINFVTPPLAEQQAIATALSDVDELIRSLDALIQKKETIKKGTMQQLLTGNKRLPGFDGEWVKVALKDRVDQFIVPMRNKPKRLDGDIPWCRIEDFSGKYLFGSKSNRGVHIETIKEMNLKVYPVDTLLVSCSADLGRCAIVKKKLVSNQTFIGLVCSQNKLSEEFLYYYMTYNADVLNELSSGTTISYLSRADFERFEIELPKTLEEQKAIAQTLSDMDEELQALRRKREKMVRVKEGMMQQLLNGRIRILGIEG